MNSSLGEQTTDLDGREGTGHLLHMLAERLYPICRSITGNGVRQTLQILKEYLPLDLIEIPTGTQVFDWTIPKEWNVNEAWIKDPGGKKIVDFVNHNLHLLNYSIPFHGHLSLSQLKKHLYSLPENPDWIPYRTSYYQENWGFCLTHRQLESLNNGEYEVYIDSTLENGSLTYGELLIPGTSDDEVLFSAHVCHPSLANDNLSGIAVLTYLAKDLLKQKNQLSYRFLFIPGTIGSIAWLAHNEAQTKKIKHGLVASLLGDSGDFTYKKSRRGNATIDQVVEHVLNHSEWPYTIRDFSPYGYDERQYCSPGFNLPVGNLTRSQFGQYPEYHTSADDLELIQPVCLELSLEVYKRIVEVLEGNFYYQNVNPKCEPQLGKRGLYTAIGGQSDQRNMQLAMLWILNFSDGQHSLLDIAQKSGFDFFVIKKMAEILVEKKLLLKMDK